MVVFHSYVKLPEGRRLFIPKQKQLVAGGFHLGSIKIDGADSIHIIHENEHINGRNPSTIPTIHQPSTKSRHFAGPSAFPWRVWVSKRSPAWWCSDDFRWPFAESASSDLRIFGKRHGDGPMDQRSGASESIHHRSPIWSLLKWQFWGHIPFSDTPKLKTQNLKTWGEVLLVTLSCQPPRLVTPWTLAGDEFLLIFAGELLKKLED